MLVQNLTGGHEHIGQHYLAPGQWVDVPYSIGAGLAGSPDYKCEDVALLGDYKFLDEDGTYLGWTSPMHYADGYGSVAQDLAQAFIEKLGVALSVHPRDYSPDKQGFGNIPLERWHREAFVPECIVERLRGEQAKCFYGINMTFPAESYRHPFPRGIGYTMFETTRLPPDWVAPANKARRLVVPCRQNKQAFIDSGITVPIDVVPLGINPGKWPFVDRAKRRTGKPFTFLMAAGITMRKNPIGAANAFVTAFPDDPDVRLVLKTRSREKALGFWEWETLLPSDTRIHLVCEDSTPEGMHSWMAQADAFVFPSHGEGFGLTPVQAMSTGLPVIVSDNSGMSEYADIRYNYPVACREVPVPPNNQGGYPESWGDVGCWWEPDFDCLVDRFREVYTRHSKALAKGRAAAEWVRSKWTVENTCRGLLDVVMRDAADCGVRA